MLANVLQTGGMRSYLLASIVLARLAVETKEGTKVELGRLQQLNFSHVDLWS
jgi:hypothetical protein